MEAKKTEEYESETSPDTSQAQPEVPTPPSTPSSISESEPARSRTRFPKPDKVKVKKKAVKIDDGWKKNSDWVMVLAHRELKSTAQVVVLERTTELTGKRVELRILTTGVWVWVPDAEPIIDLQHLASCRGPDMTVGRPFNFGQSSAVQNKGRPYGPPKK